MGAMAATVSARDKPPHTIDSDLNYPDGIAGFFSLVSIPLFYFMDSRIKDLLQSFSPGKQTRQVSLLLLVGVAIAGYAVDRSRPPAPQAAIDPLVTLPSLPPLPPTSPDSPPATFLTSTDGKSEINLLPDWLNDPELNDKAQIQASNRTRQMYLIVLVQNRRDLNNMTTADYSKITQGYLTRRLDKSQVTGPTAMTQIGSDPAYPTVQYEVRGSLNQIDVVYLHTVVETPTRLVQILAWTPPAAFETNQLEMQQVIQSFREK